MVAARWVIPDECRVVCDDDHSGHGRSEPVDSRPLERDMDIARRHLQHGMNGAVVIVDPGVVEMDRVGMYWLCGSGCSEQGSSEVGVRFPAERVIAQNHVDPGIFIDKDNGLPGADGDHALQKHVRAIHVDIDGPEYGSRCRASG